MMTVRIVLPSRMLGSWEAKSVTAEGAHGSFGMRPRHIDYVAVIRPGIVALRLVDDEELFVAVDHGILVKRGNEVSISTRRGLVSDDLELLSEQVEQLVRQRDEGELRARAAASKLEVGFVRRLIEIEEELRGR